ncbi:Prefoldin subunit 6 [Paecilomyces lecythidis]
MADVQKQLQALSDEYQKLQTDPCLTKKRPAELETNVEARQKLESQQQENKAVQNEFASLDEEANIYKLVGPVLLKQDKTEATMAVDGRLEFIEKEIKRIEDQIKETQEKSDKKRAEIVQFQSQIQQQGAAATASA